MEKVIRVCDKNGKPLYTRVYAWSDFRQQILSYPNIVKIREQIKKEQEEEIGKMKINGKENLEKVLKGWLK
jgi:hypothetical protein